MTIPQRKPYAGTENTLVIGIDIGTALSGVAYALLEPGKVPRIQPVTRFSGQREENSNSKVPSVVCYDQDGKVIATGPETNPEENPTLFEKEGVRRAEWFKLRLRPLYLAADRRSQIEKIWSLPDPAEENDDYARAFEEEVHLDSEGEGSGPEPLNKKKMLRPVTDDFKTVVQVFADFLRYLFQHAKEYIITTEKNLDPTFTWSAIEGNVYFVLTHPNGWEGRAQSQMRDSAIAAGLVNSSTAANRITFVTEGEASLHFYLDKVPQLHQRSGSILMVDGGSETINLNTYSQTENGCFKEIVSPDCLLHGSIFITSRARDYFKRKFKDSKFGTENDIEAMTKAFDKPEGVKCIFNDPNKPYFVNFGSLRDNDQRCGITGGRFKIEGTQVAKFFEPTVEDIVAGIVNQCRNAKDRVSVKYILLVGGFGRSQYLYAKLGDYFNTSDTDVIRPGTNDTVCTYRHKAVPEGAVSWYLDRCVSSRVTKYAYGVEAEVEFDPANPEHVYRADTKYTYANGKICIPGGFSTMLKRDTSVCDRTQTCQPHSILFTPDEHSRCSSIIFNLKCYRGQADSPPEWIDLEPNSFHDLCTIQADMSTVKRSMERHDSGSNPFYKLNLDLVILFGSTELKAHIAWKEDGTERRYALSVDDGMRSS